MVAKVKGANNAVLTRYPCPRQLADGRRRDPCLGIRVHVRLTSSAPKRLLVF